ncbi:MAG: EVE domain-containing protein [Candidatus Asgardarchaeia archaeon]
MAYWLCITTEENWNVIREKNVWGVPERHKKVIERVKTGDKLLIYVKQQIKKDKIIDPRIVAVYEAISEVFKDYSKIFKTPPGMENEAFPLRIKLKLIKIFEKPVDFKSLIPQLKFITNKQRWTGHLIGRAMREIPEDDYQLIIKKEE